MKRYWRTVAPPMDVITAAHAGWRPPVKADRRKGGLGELISMFSGAGGVIN